jgi:tetracycline resistance efflux pump
MGILWYTLAEFCFLERLPRMSTTWIVLIPPLIVILLAALTKRILFSLFLGILSSALIVAQGNFVEAFFYIAKRFWLTSQLERLKSLEGFLACSNLFLLSFLVLIGILITMIRHSGAAYAYGAFVMNKIKTARGAERASLLLSKFFFIDDYFGSITIGSVMQPITDQFAIPRVKLALLVCSLAAPMAIIVPVSTWVADLIGQLRNSGVGLGAAGSIIKVDPFTLYVMSIPFMLYAVIMILTVWYLVSSRLSYGLVAKHERYARKTGELFGGKMPVARRVIDVSEILKKTSTLFDFLLPIGLLVITAVFFILWTGDWRWLGGENTLLDALPQARIYFSFFMGGVCAVFGTLGYYLARQRIAVIAIPEFFLSGFSLMSSSLLMLIFIWTLSGIIRDDLKTGTYLANMLVGQVAIPFVPLMFFGLSALIATLMGTAWGALGILIPLALEMVPSLLGLPAPIDIANIPMLPALIGAIVSGSVVGNHLSPVSDISVMSATSVGAYHLDLVRAQIQLTIPTFFASLLGYYVVGLTLCEYGFMTSSVLGIIAGFLVNAMLMQVLAFICRRTCCK